jgi:IPT/TIG domain
MKIIPTLMLALVVAIGLGCGYSKNSMTAQPGAMPAIAQLSPNSASAGAAFSLTVNGSNFASNAVVNFGSTAINATFISGNQIMANIPSSADMTAGMVKVMVTNPGSSGGMYGGGTMPETSAAVSFTIN